MKARMQFRRNTTAASIERVAAMTAQYAPSILRMVEYTSATAFLADTNAASMQQREICYALTLSSECSPH